MWSLGRAEPNLELGSGTLKVTDWLAVYAACLSTAVFVWNVARATPRAKVEIVFGSSERDGKMESGLFIVLKNPSSHEVHLRNLWILSPSDASGIFDKVTYLVKYRKWPEAVGWVHARLPDFGVEDGMPLSLSPGKSHHVFVPGVVVDELLADSERKELKAAVYDEVGRRSYSPAFAVR